MELVGGLGGAGEDCAPDGDVSDVAGIAGQRVGGEHREVRVFTGFDGTDDVVEVELVGGIDGDRSEGLVGGDGFVGSEDAAGGCGSFTAHHMVWSWLRGVTGASEWMEKRTPSRAAVAQVSILWVRSGPRVEV